MKNVGRFDIAMHEPDLMDLCVSLDELPHDFDGLVVWQCPSLLKNAVEVALAELSDEVGIVLCSVYIMQPEHVLGLAETFECCYFKLE
jgi:hypothetical protein